MNDSGDDLFMQEVGDIQPLQVAKKATIKRNVDSALALKARRESAAKELVEDCNHLSDDFVDLLDPYCPLEFKRPGVQHGVYRRLKQGKYTQEARLDLHRMTVERARREVYEFIKQSAAYDLRTIAIVHGKGSHSQSDEALLKSYVNKWLPELEEVQAFCSAQPQHGGLGAVYIQLRKSENKKQENRDRLSRGRTVAGD